MCPDSSSERGDGAPDSSIPGEATNSHYVGPSTGIARGSPELRTPCCLDSQVAYLDPLDEIRLEFSDCDMTLRDLFSPGEGQWLCSWWPQDGSECQGRECALGRRGEAWGALVSLF